MNSQRQVLRLDLAEVVASVVFPDTEAAYLLLAAPGVEVQLVPSGRTVDEVVALSMLADGADRLSGRLQGTGRHRA